MDDYSRQNMGLVNQLTGNVGELRGSIAGIVDRQGRQELQTSKLSDKIDQIDEKIDSLVRLVEQGRGAGWMAIGTMRATRLSWGALCSAVLVFWILAEKFHWFGL